MLVKEVIKEKFDFWFKIGFLNEVRKKFYCFGRKVVGGFR